MSRVGSGSGPEPRLLLDTRNTDERGTVGGKILKTEGRTERGTVGGKWSVYGTRGGRDRSREGGEEGGGVTQSGLGLQGQEGCGGVILLQGPPGTGKTTTIVAILAEILHRRPNPNPNLECIVTRRIRIS